MGLGLGMKFDNWPRDGRPLEEPAVRFLVVGGAAPSPLK